ISSLVLKRAKKVAEKSLGGVVDSAVITVPASFNELQRAATKNAGVEAGLKVLRILNEPTAAALAYGLGREGAAANEAERIAVYDFGGGTFDLTLLDLSGAVIEVISTAGDNFLGGDDFDQLILDKMCQAVLQQTRLDPRGDVQLMERLRADYEQVKIALTDENEVTIELREVGYGAGGVALNAEYSMSRMELEMLAAPLIEKSIEVCKRAMELGRLDVDAFDKVILVGGSTRMPLMRQMVESYFQKPAMTELNPDEVVAMGASIQAAALAESDAKRATSIAHAAASKFRAPTVTRAGAPGRVPVPPPPPAPGVKDAVVGKVNLVKMPVPVAQSPAVEAAAPPRKPPAPPPIPVRASPMVAVSGSPLNTTAPTGSLTENSVPFAGLPEPSSPHDMFGSPEIPAAPEPPRAPPPIPNRLPGIAPAMRAPLLVDVTPLTLAVETVGGYVDAVIARNTAVPTSQTRTFTTSKDGQTEVVVKVCQGEEPSFGGNVFLGELQLSGLRASRRGDAQIEVTFELDADGMLQVRAVDLESRREIRTTMKMDATAATQGGA
ncbi:MAG: Hsp70 family protein, partial [Polyangiales bacterium]